MIVLTFHCLNKLFKSSQTFCKFSALSLEFQKKNCRSLEQFFLTLGQNNFGNRIQFHPFMKEYNGHLAHPNTLFLLLQKYVLSASELCQFFILLWWQIFCKNYKVAKASQNLFFRFLRFLPAVLATLLS